MSDLVDAIREVAGFAGTERAGMFGAWSVLHFAPGEVLAQDGMIGARMPVDLDLTCGVNAVSMVKALKAVTGDPSITQDKGGLVIKSGTATIKLATLAADMAPKFYRPPVKAVWHLAAMGDVKKIAWCVNPSRSNLSGIYLAADMQVTNGHVAINRTGVDFVKLLGRAALVDPRVFVGLPPDVWMTLHDNTLFVAKDDQGSKFRSAKVTDSLFPDLDGIIDPIRKYAAASAPRDALVEVIKRARVGAADGVLRFSKGKVGISVGGEKSIFDFLDSVGLTDSEIKPCEVLLSLSYLQDVLEACPAGDVLLRVEGPESAVGVSGGDMFAAIMPIRA